MPLGLPIAPASTTAAAFATTATASTTAAATTTVATATAAASTTATATIATTTAATAPTTTATATTAGTRCTLACFADANWTALNRTASQSFNRLRRVRVGAHLDEGKPAGSTGLAIHHDFDLDDISPTLGESLSKFRLGDVVRQISYVKPRSHLRSPWFTDCGARGHLPDCYPHMAHGWP